MNFLKSFLKTLNDWFKLQSPLSNRYDDGLMKNFIIEDSEYHLLTPLLDWASHRWTINVVCLLMRCGKNGPATYDISLPKQLTLNQIKTLEVTCIARKGRTQQNKAYDITKKETDKSRMWDIPQDKQLTLCNQSMACGRNRGFSNLKQNLEI